jgi:hypothetical protein
MFSELQAKTCMSSASLMVEDMQSLYGCRKNSTCHINTTKAFDLTDVKKNVLKKKKK